MDTIQLETCVICYEDLNNQLYVTISGEGENNKYHFDCIEKWLDTSNNGILVQKPIEYINIHINEDMYHMKMIRNMPPEDDYMCDNCIIF